MKRPRNNTIFSLEWTENVKTLGLLSGGLFVFVISRESLLFRGKYTQQSPRG